jgi:type I restriction enzyme R subunit
MSPAGSKNAPEAKARDKIDVALAQAGWLVQDRDDMNLTVGDAIAVREFKLQKGHGYVDYLLFVDGAALGVIEAKPAGYSLSSVEVQAKKYGEGLPASLTAPRKPLPFAYISTGEETVFINTLDPYPRSRPVFSFHRPETLREWMTADTLDAWVRQTGRLDDDVLAWFKDQVHRAGGGSYQALINQALREFVASSGEPLEQKLRRVVREELQRAS